MFIVVLIACLRIEVVIGCGDTGIGTGQGFYLENRCFIQRRGLAGYNSCAIISFRRIDRCLLLQYMDRVYPIPLCLDSLELCFGLGDSVDFVLRLDAFFRSNSFSIYMLSYDMGDYSEIYMLLVGFDGRVLGFCGIGWSYYGDRYEYSYVRIDSVVGNKIYLTSVESAGLVLTLGDMSNSKGYKGYVDSVLSLSGVKLNVALSVDSAVANGAISSNDMEVCLERYHSYKIVLIPYNDCVICVGSVGLVNYRLSECASGP